MEGKEEKRAFTRLPRGFHLEVRELLFPMNDQPRFESTCHDISPGGLCFQSSRRFNVGDKLQVRVHIPTLNKFSPGFYKVHENDAEQYLGAIVEVSWVEQGEAGYMTGLRFVDADDDACHALSGLIHKSLQATP